MGNILMLDSRLTVIKTLAQAGEVLDSVRRQNASLFFDKETFKKARFTPQDGEWTVWEYDESMGIPVEFQPAIRMSYMDAVKRLYQLRKHYNAKWRD
jgi:hypothetical protein